MKHPAVGGALVFLVLLPLIVFVQVLDFDFLTYDDPTYVSENPHLREGVSRKGIEWALKADLLFNSVNADYWQPATFFSRLIDVELWGLDPKGHHLTNLLLHLANTLLLFLLLNQMTGAVWRSAWAAAFFAVHPLAVEPVAWITARKDLLSTFFGLAALAIYPLWAKRAHFLSGFFILLFFCLSLMSKPWLVTLPFLLLLMDDWPLGRFKFSGRIFLEKLPLVIFSLLAFWVVSRGTSETVSGALYRNYFLEAPVYYLNFLLKAVYPMPLALVYPPQTAGLGKALGSAALLILVTAFAFRRRKSSPAVWAGWLWFLIALFPGTAGARIQNRFAYVPLMGLGILFSWYGAEIFQKVKIPKLIAKAAALLPLIILAVLSSAEASHWRNSVSLFEHNVKVTGRNALAHANLALALEKQGRKQEAAEHYSRALEIDPGHQMSHHGLGLILLGEGKAEEAVAHFRIAIEADPHLAELHNNLCVAFIRQQKFEEALAPCERAISESRDYLEAYNNLGVVWNGLGNPEKAAAAFKKALAIDPENFILRKNLEALASLDKE